MSRREESPVPEMEFRSYYGRQILKDPEWKRPDVPLYLFVAAWPVRRPCWPRSPT